MRDVMMNVGLGCGCINRSSDYEGFCVADTSVAAVVSESPAGEMRARRPKRETYGKKAKEGALWAMGRETVTQLLTIPTTFVLARLLTPADFGIAAAASFFIQLGKRMGNMGLNTALVRMPDVREEHRASVFFINFVFGLVAWGALMLAAPAIGAFYGDERVVGAVRVASTIFLVNFFGAVEFAVLQRDMKFKEMAFVEWTTPIVFLPIAAGMAFLGYGYWSLLVAQLAANTASTCSKVYFGRWRPSLAVTRRGLADTVPFGMGVYAKRLLTHAADTLDSFIVGGLYGVTWLGFYDKAFNAADGLTTRFTLGSNVMFRIFSIIQDDRPRFIRAYSKVVLAGTIVTLPVFAGLIVAAREFILVVFGQQWLQSVLPFQLLCAAGALRLVTAYPSAAVQASGRVWGEVWRKLAQLALIIGLIFVFRPWGIVGAAAAVFVSAVILTGLMQGLVASITGLTWPEMLKPLWPGAVAAVITTLLIGGVTVLARMWMPTIPDWAVLILQVATAGIGWLTFTLFGRFAALQDVVDEVLDDVVPAVIRRQIDRVRRRRPDIAEA